MNNEELNKILFSLENVARKHTIEVCDNGSMIETMPAQQIDELRLNNYSAKILLNYINKQKEVLDKIKEEIDMLNVVDCNIPNYIICITKINEILEEIDSETRK